MKKIIPFLNKYLKLEKYPNDNSNNGLQVEVNRSIKRICLAVDISLGAIEFSKQNNCDLIICHHGISWSDSLKYITERNYLIINNLIKNSIGLYSVHAPLDVHPVVGNNVQIAKRLGLKKLIPFGEYKGIIWGYSSSFKTPLSESQFLKKISFITKNPIYHIIRPIRRMGIISGGGSFALQESYEKKIDTLLTGETSHSNLVYAKDMKLNIIFAGHYNTETFGVMALGKIIEKKFGIKTIFYNDNTNL